MQNLLRMRHGLAKNLLHLIFSCNFIIFNDNINGSESTQKNFVRRRNGQGTFDLSWSQVTLSDLEKEDDFPMTGPAPCTLRRILFLFLTIGVPYLLICGYFYFLAEEDLDELIQAKWNIFDPGFGSSLGLIWVWFRPCMGWFGSG